MASSAHSTTALLLFAAALVALLTTKAYAASILNAGQQLSSGQSLAQGPRLFVMQQDCNLVLYDSNKAVWASGTNGRASGCNLKMQHDCNLVIYSGSRAIWASNTNRGIDGCFLILQRDRNVVIYDKSNNVIWATGTNVGNAVITAIPHKNGTVAASGAVQNKVNELHP